MKRVAFFFLLSFLSSLVWSQNYSATPFFANDQIPKTIYDLLEDKNGNIWMGTDEGLIKWNGVVAERFANYNHPFEYSNLALDEKGRVWFVNFSKQIFYLENDTVKLFHNLINDYQSFTYDVSALANIEIASDKAIWHINYHSGEIIEEKVKFENNDLSQIESRFKTKRFEYFISRGRLFVNFDNELKRLTDIKSTLLGNVQYVKSPISLKIGDTLYTALNCKFNGKDYLSLKAHVGDEKIQESILERNGYILQNLDVINNRVFLSTTNGVILLNQHFEILTEIPIVEGKKVSSITLDRENVFWISTLNSGVYRVLSQDIDAVHFGRSNNKMRWVLNIADTNLLFLTTDGKIFNRSNKISSFETGYDLERIYHLPSNDEIGFTNNKLVYNYKKELLLDNQFGIDVKSISTVNKNVALTSNSNSAAFQFLNNDTLLSKFVNSGGLSLIEASGYKYLNLGKEKSYFNYFNHADSTFYIAWYRNLTFHDKNGRADITFKNKPILSKALIPNKYGGIYVGDQKGNIYDINQLEAELLTTYNGDIHEIIKSGDFLLIAGDNGILRYNLKSHDSKYINKPDGLPSNMVHSLAVLNDSIYAVTENGVVKYDLNYSYLNKVQPKLYFYKISINQQDTVLQEKYFLNSNQNNIQIELGVVSNRSEGKAKFSYRLIGLDTNWIENGTNRSITFSYLPSGEYNFQAVAFNEDGVESKVEQLIFSISKPFYYRSWFIFILVSLAVILGLAFYRLKIQSIKKDNEKQLLNNELSKAKLSALSSQMNPHFIFNALNSIQEFIITNNKELASDYLGLFADLIRKYLAQSNQNEITLEEEIATLKMYLELEQIRFEDKLAWQIEEDLLSESNQLKIPVMLVQPFVENALKHGLLHRKSGRKLTIKFSEQARGKIDLTIEDNGIGRKNSQELNRLKQKYHESFATSAIANRMNLLNKDKTFRIKLVSTDLEKDNLQFPGTKVRLEIERIV